MVDIYIESVPSPELRHSIGERMVRKQASVRLGIDDPTQVAMWREASGKPMIPRISFNLSHSGALAVCAFSDAPVGIDIERIGPARLPLAKRFFHPHEVDILFKTPKEEQDLLFFRIWTMKEAYLKRSGLGISGGLRGFDVFSIDPPLFHTAVLDGEYCLAVCTSHPCEIGECPSHIQWSVR